MVFVIVVVVIVVVVVVAVVVVVVVVEVVVIVVGLVVEEYMTKWEYIHTCIVHTVGHEHYLLYNHTYILLSAGKLACGYNRRPDIGFRRRWRN